MLASIYAGALRRSLVTAAVGNPVAARFATARALPIRTFAVSTRSAFPAAAAVTRKKTTATTTKKQPATSAAAKKATTTSKKTATSAAAKKKKEAAAKRKPVVKKKAVLVKKRTVTKRKAVSKKKPVVRKKRAATPEEKLAKKKRVMRETVIKEPKPLPTAIWNIFVKQQVAAGPAGAGVIKRVAEFSAAYKALSPVEVQKLREQAEQNKAANEAAHVAFVSKLSVDEIKQSNLARARLNRLSPSSRRAVRARPIRDPRVPKMPPNAYSQFTSSRWASGEFEGVSVPDAAKRMSAEWKSLTAAQKQPYIDISDAARAKHQKVLQSLRA